MKKATLLFLIVLSISPAYAQLSSGLIAHWDFNGTTSDISGNGHNATGSNITYTTGKSGVSNTAALFDGQSSYAMVPYHSSFNLNKFTICAVIKVNGYYTGLCQGNYILMRGASHSVGHYALLYADNPYDNADCNHSDTSEYVFYSNIANTASIIPQAPWKYSPTITSGQWYCVVSTYDGTKNDVYVNGVLKSSVNLPTSSVGTSTEGISIGGNRFASYTTYPYWINGAVSDLRLYDRVLSPSEVNQYCDLVDTVTEESSSVVSLTSKDISVYPNPTKGSFTVTMSKITGNEVNIELISTIGQTVYTQQLKPVAGRINEQITTNLPASIYLLRLSTQGQHWYERLIIR